MKKVYLTTALFVCIVVLGFVIFKETSLSTKPLPQGPAGTEGLVEEVDRTLLLTEEVIAAGEANMGSLDSESKAIVKSVIEDLKEKRERLRASRLKLTPTAGEETLKELRQNLSDLKKELDLLITP